MADELAVLARAKEDLARTRAIIQGHLNSSGIQAAIGDINAQNGVSHGRKFIAPVRTDHLLLTEQRESRALLAEVVEVMTDVLEVQRQESNAIAALMEESKRQAEWTPFVFLVAVVAMMASIASVIVPLFT